MNVALRAATYQSPVAPVAASAGARISRIAFFDDLAAAEGAWRRLEAGNAVYSPYQRFDWVKLWHEHVSWYRGTSPCIMIGYDVFGEPLFLLPLARDRFGPLDVAIFFGGKHATINMALWRRDFAAGLTADDMRGLLERIAHAGPAIDLLMLFSQPPRWNGVINPFMLLPCQRANEDNFRLTLSKPGAAVIERQLSASMRSRLRNKERKLARLAGYRYARATSGAEVDRILDAFFTQKDTKLTSLGLSNVFAERGVEPFIRAICHAGLESGNPLVELHALEGDGELLALFSGLHDGHRFTSMFNSHSLSENSRFSPGLILLQHLITECADRGFEAFDVGPGEARYKTFFCSEFEPIFDSFLPLSAWGRLAAPLLRAGYFFKSEVKRSPLMWPLAHVIRRFLRKSES